MTDTPSTALTPVDHQPPARIVPGSVEEAWRLAQRLATTPFVPRGLAGKPENVFAAILHGRELGLGDMQSLHSIYVVDSKPYLSAETQRALVVRHGHRINFDEVTNTKVTVTGTRADTGAQATISWTIDDAAAAGLASKDTWKKHPRQMLIARATTDLCRILFSDVILGLAGEPLDIADAVDIDPPAPVVNEHGEIIARGRTPDTVHVVEDDSAIVDADIVDPDPDSETPVEAPLPEDMDVAYGDQRADDVWTGLESIKASLPDVWKQLQQYARDQRRNLTRHALERDPEWVRQIEAHLEHILDTQQQVA